MFELTVMGTFHITAFLHGCKRNQDSTHTNTLEMIQHTYEEHIEATIQQFKDLKGAACQYGGLKHSL